MASSKKPTYKVKTKLAVERKRRKSDLVVMWQSVWHVTSIIGQELWMTLLRMWELIQLWFSSSERFQAQAWLEKYLPYVPDDFSDSWRDGRLLAILLNKLQPGCFPDAHQLDPDYKLKNVYKVFDVLESYFAIKPNVSVEEIVTCTDGSDTKLLAIILNLMKLSENKPDKEAVTPEADVTHSVDQCRGNQNCIAKGTGLTVGFVGKLTSFIIFCASMSDIDIVIEIKGSSTICSERITKRSPKKKRPISPLEYSKCITRSVSCNEEFGENSTLNDDYEKFIIPLQYEIRGNQLSFSYRPIEKGHHKITILCHGQHVSDSPYTVSIEDASHKFGINEEIHLKSVLKHINESEENKKRKISVRFQEQQVKCSDQKKPSVKIRGKRILGFIVKINGKDVPINAESIESLATELLKMDYNCEKCPSFQRRNSWGFAGDAERKRSVIRQFCVDVKELEAQASQRRSNSLSINPGSKKVLQKSDSLESLPSKLNIVSEDIFECCDKDHSVENEADFAFLNEDLDSVFHDARIKYEQRFNAQKQKDSLEENAQPNLSNESIESNLVTDFIAKCNQVVDSEVISSLSTEILLKKKVDNLNEDPSVKIAMCTSTLDSSFSTVQTAPETEILEREISDIEPVLSSITCKSLESQLSKDLILAEDKNLVKKSSKRKKIPYVGKCNYIRKRKRSSLVRTPHKVRKETTHKKLPENKTIILPTITILEKQSPDKDRKQECKIISDIPYDNEAEDSSAEENVEQKNLCKKQKNNTKCIPKKNSDIYSFTQSISLPNTSESKRNNLNPSLQVSVSKNTEKKKRKEVRCSFVNITNYSDILGHTTEISKQGKIQPKAKKLNLNHTPNTALAQAEKNDISEIYKPLRTHTLTTFKQLNFKQFNPIPEYNSGPVKSQIEQWENSLSTEKQNSPARKTSASETEQGNVKEKLAFWENTYKAEQISSKQSTVENNRKMNGTTDNPGASDNQGCYSLESNSNTKTDNLHNPLGTGIATSCHCTTTKEPKETINLINKKNNEIIKKEADDKLNLDLQPNFCKTNKRSFSDPGVLENVSDGKENSSNSFLETSSKEQLSSSNDDNLKEDYFEEDESGASDFDSCHRSSGDEYIDDEIQERASEYWGDLGILKGMEVAGAVEDYSFWGEQIFQSHCQRSKSFPEECQVFGIAVYYGYVAEKNRFQVFTGGAGFGNLSVSIQGLGQHDVSLVSVTYVRNDIYEVTYQVMTAGYYLISIRWMDKAIPGSPFVCRVTY